MQEASASEVSKIFGSRTRKLGIAGTIGAFRQWKIDAREFFIGAAEWLDHEKIGVIRRLHDPVALANSDQSAGLTGECLRHGLLADFSEDVGVFFDEGGECVLVVPGNHLVAFVANGLPLGFIILHDAILVMRGTITEDPGIG